MEAFLISFGVIFVAELGDKSQLMALAFATRYRPIPILIGITIATALVHLVSVVVGSLLGDSFPTSTINILAGVAFLGFAAWTLRGDDLTEDEAERVNKSDRSAVVAAGVAFFLAEIGDKTMLATMVAADALAIGVGAALGKKLPERAIRIGATVSFVIFGLLLILEGTRG